MVLLNYDGILLDAYGVFWSGNDLFPGAKEAMANLVAKGKVVGVLSNTTNTNAKEKERYLRYGLLEGVHYHFYITAGDLVRALLKTDPLLLLAKTYWLWGENGAGTLFNTPALRLVQHFEEADFIYVTVPQRKGCDETDSEVFRAEVKRLAPYKVPMLCANPDLFAHEGNPPRPVVRQGSIAKLYEEYGGSVFYVGKPYIYAFETAKNEFAHRGVTGNIIMVGDTPETDIRGGNRARLSTALVTKTGIFAERKVQALDALDSPTHFIESLYAFSS